MVLFIALERTLKEIDLGDRSQDIGFRPTKFKEFNFILEMLKSQLDAQTWRSAELSKLFGRSVWEL